jgi:hypothetical protein
MILFSKKGSKYNLKNQKPSTIEDSSLTTVEEYDHDNDAKDETFQEQLSINLELQFSDIRSAINLCDMAENNSAMTKSKRALL